MLACSGPARRGLTRKCTCTRTRSENIWACGVDEGLEPRVFDAMLGLAA